MKVLFIYEFIDGVKRSYLYDNVYSLKQFADIISNIRQIKNFKRFIDFSFITEDNEIYKINYIIDIEYINSFAINLFMLERMPLYKEIYDNT